MKKFSLILIPAAILILLIANEITQPTDLRSNIDVAREMYREILETEPSLVNAQTNDEIIRARLECYDKNIDSEHRAKTCNKEYMMRIIAATREDLKTKPRLGEFIAAAADCPIMFSMCVGSGKNIEDCITFERRCIDFCLDQYWRGGALVPFEP